MKNMLPKLFKAPRLRIAVAICALIVLLGVLLLPHGVPGDNVQVALVGFTNQSGHKIALFCGTNDSKRTLTYDLDVKTNIFGYSYEKGLLMVQRGGPIQPGQSFTFSMDAPAETADWQPVFMYRLGCTKSEECRGLVAELFYKVGMECLAQKMVPPTPEGSISMYPMQKPERWLAQYEIGD